MNVIIVGAAGHMGREISRRLADCGENVAAEVDISLPCSSIEQFSGSADVIVDFSTHTAAPSTAAYAAKRGIPLVMAVTGHTPEELASIKEASKKIPVFMSANMSLGVAVLARFVKQAALAFPDADIEIVEAHHNRKIDAPSGTALMLTEVITSARPGMKANCGRSGRGRREPDEIGIHSLRMGNLVGEHEVIFSTGSESVSLKHTAYDRGLFADGATAAARFIIGKPAGIYSMEELMAEKFPSGE